jgi:hypothetical protein
MMGLGGNGWLRYAEIRCQTLIASQRSRQQREGRVKPERWDLPLPFGTGIVTLIGSCAG